MKTICKLLTIGLVGFSSLSVNAQQSNLDPMVPTNENGELILYWCGSVGPELGGAYVGVGFTQIDAYEVMLNKCQLMNGNDAVCENAFEYICEEVKIR